MPGVEDGVNLDLPPGLTSRPATAADARAILELIATCEVDADGVAEVEEHDITVAFGRRAFDPVLDTQLVFEDGELVGWADLYRSRGEGDVRPTHRSRGIGTALLEWMERRAQSLLRTSFGWFFERGRRVAGVSTDSRTGALGVYERGGMRVQRQYTRYTKRLG